MRPAERLFRALLRWNRLGIAGLLALPFVGAMVLGFVWLHERGWLMWFVLATAGLAATVWALRLLLRLRAARQDAAPEAPPSGGRQLPPPEPDPDWSEAEAAAFATAAEAIAGRLAAGPLPWEALPAEALQVVETIAAAMSDGRRGALDFTLPEALLLVDRVALRYRAVLRSHVPFSDQVSIRAGYWLWRRREGARMAVEAGFLAWRGLRLAINPTVGVLREVERAVTAGLQDRLSTELLRDAQAILLEEVAQAAVDLYSGRLRFSEAELAAIELGSERRDRAALARPDDPLRILVVGQVSAGKSSLVNALMAAAGGAATAETDAAPTTDRAAAHPLEIDDIPCRLVDMPGLDGSDARRDAMLAEIAEADLVLWVLRANRPARAPDHALRAAMAGWFAARPARRAPPVILVASFADALLPGWPFPEGHLPQDAQTRLGAAMAALAGDMDGQVPIPLRGEAPTWNLDTLVDALSAALGEALMVQRNRRRVAAAQAAGGLRLGENLARAGRGARAGAAELGGRLLGRLRSRRDTQAD